MNKQYVEGLQKQTAAHLIMRDSKMATLALLFNDRAGDTVFMVQAIEVKDGEKGFLSLPYDNP